MRLIMLALPLLGACAQQAAITASTEPAIPFHCPPDGMRATVAGANGRVSTTIFAGADPADPLVCLSGRNRSARRFLNYFPLAAGSERQVRDGLAPLFPVRLGNEVRFSYTQGYVNDPTRRGLLMEHWTALGPETLTIDGKPVQTIAFKREVEEQQRYGSMGYERRLWWAIDSGVWVKDEPKLLRGSVTGLTPSTVTKITMP